MKKEFVNNDNNLYLEDIQDLKIIFELNNFISSQEDLIKLKNHLWTPVEISQKLDFLEFRSVTEIVRDITFPHIKLYWNKIEPNEEKYMFSVLNDKEYTLRDFITEYKKLILACEKWLGDNSFSKKGLNI